MSIKRHIPNTITCLNLVSGCMATYMAFQGSFGLALGFIVLGAVFDFFDGMTARLLGVGSPIGKELDSLADCITFGFAPSAMLAAYLRILCPDGACQYGILLLPAAFIMAAFSALRLAKFNLDERQALGFIGLPTPANALFWGSLIVGLGNAGGAAGIPGIRWMLVAGMLVSCWLLVCEIPMFALKFKHWGWKGNEVKYLFVLSCIPLLLFLGILGIAAVILWYILLSILTNKKPV